MDEMLSSPLATRLAELSGEELERDLVNDLYKPNMHNLYAQFFKGVSVDFMLNVRKSPFQLDRIQKEVRHAGAKCDPDLQQNKVVT